jgi:hypothetical protein
MVILLMRVKFLPVIRGFVRGADGEFCAVSAGRYEGSGVSRSAFVTMRLKGGVRSAVASGRVS